MAGLPAWPGRRRPELLALCALATLPAACAGTPRPVPPHPSTVAAAVRVLERQMDENLKHGRSYSLTELEGLSRLMLWERKARDAARLWDAEVRAQYRARRRAMRAALEAEVRDYDRARIEVILGGAKLAPARCAPRAPRTRAG